MLFTFMCDFELAFWALQLKKSPKIPYTGVVTSSFCNFHMMSTKRFVSNRLIGAYIGVIYSS